MTAPFPYHGRFLPLIETARVAIICDIWLCARLGRRWWVPDGGDGPPVRLPIRTRTSQGTLRAVRIVRSLHIKLRPGLGRRRPRPGALRFANHV